MNWPDMQLKDAIPYREAAAANKEQRRKAAPQGKLGNGHQVPSPSGAKLYQLNSRDNRQQKVSCPY